MCFAETKQLACVYKTKFVVPVSALLINKVVISQATVPSLFMFKTLIQMKIHDPLGTKNDHYTEISLDNHPVAHGTITITNILTESQA